MHPSLAQLDHRPWPLPSGRWKWRQQWRDSAFIHYRVDAKALAAFLPAGLQLEQYDGSAWLSVVPFEMADVAPRSLPSIPPLRSFPELNLRAYVTDGRKSGVWFFSLDADCTPLVIGARILYSLPYHRAKIRMRRNAEQFQFASVRRSAPVHFEARYAPTGDVFYGRPGTFEHWVAERYCLFSHHRGRVLCLDVHHGPWPLQRAEVEVTKCDLFRAASIEGIGEPAVCHFSRGVEVISFDPVFVSQG